MSCHCKFWFGDNRKAYCWGNSNCVYTLVSIQEVILIFKSFYKCSHSVVSFWETIQLVLKQVDEIKAMTNISVIFLWHYLHTNIRETYFFPFMTHLSSNYHYELKRRNSNLICCPKCHYYNETYFWEIIACERHLLILIFSLYWSIIWILVLL